MKSIEGKIGKEIEEIKKFDFELNEKSNEEIEKSLENNSVYLITRLEDKKPTAIYIKFNGFSEVFNYKNFEEYFPNLFKYRESRK